MIHIKKIGGYDTFLSSLAVLYLGVIWGEYPEKWRRGGSKVHLTPNEPPAAPTNEMPGIDSLEWLNTDECRPCMLLRSDGKRLTDI